MRCIAGDAIVVFMRALCAVSQEELEAGSSSTAASAAAVGGNGAAGGAGTAAGAAGRAMLPGPAGGEPNKRGPLQLCLHVQHADGGPTCLACLYQSCNMAVFYHRTGDPAHDLYVHIRQPCPGIYHHAADRHMLFACRECAWWPSPLQPAKGR